MCMPRAPEMPPPPPPPPPIPTPARDDPEVTRADRTARRRRQLAAGRQSTLITGGEGVTQDANTGSKSLLGA
mgnify:CR=1 FL=1|jgi:hypothetical protein